MDCNDLGGGFKLAMNDLQIRGGGNLLGISQSGNIAAIGYDLYLDLLQKTVADVPVRMMLANEELKTVLVSIHMSLRRAIEAVTFDNVLQTLLITHQAVSASLGRAPRIAVAGLNPHAGEGGYLGREEIDVITPTLRRLGQEGLRLTGPVPADTAFLPERLAGFDAVLAMYHDQGLPVLKYKGFGHAVNITLGLPIIRTSVDHGTALDLAGTGKADTGSLQFALQTAHEMASRSAAMRAAERG